MELRTKKGVVSVKVAEINALDCGSTGKIMLNIARVADEKGIEMHTFSSSRAAKGTDLKCHEYIDKYIDYSFHMIFGMLLGYETSFSYFATKRLVKRLKEISPDIIHLHNTHGWFLNHKVLFDYISEKNIKVIWTLHDCWTFTGRCPHFQITGCERWKTGCHNCIYDKKQYPASYFFDKSKRQWKQKKKMFTSVKDMVLVTPSEWLKGLVEESYMGKYPVCVINNGIDLSIFSPKESNFRERYNLKDKYVILGVANSWGERKGYDVFLELARRLDDKFRIVLVGVNKQQIFELPENMIGIERTANQKELAMIYSVADVFANPTREDNFPTVNMEALACGTPVITFDTGGSPEIIDETCGSVIKNENIEVMEKEIRRICNTMPYHSDLCVSRATKYDMNEKFLEYVRLYTEKVKRK